MDRFRARVMFGFGAIRLVALALLFRRRQRRKSGPSTLRVEVRATKRKEKAALAVATVSAIAAAFSCFYTSKQSVQVSHQSEILAEQYRVSTLAQDYATVSLMSVSVESGEVSFTNSSTYAPPQIYLWVLGHTAEEPGHPARGTPGILFEVDAPIAQPPGCSTVMVRTDHLVEVLHGLRDGGGREWDGPPPEFTEGYVALTAPSGKWFVIGTGRQLHRLDSEQREITPIWGRFPLFTLGPDTYWEGFDSRYSATTSKALELTSGRPITGQFGLNSIVTPVPCTM